MTIFDNKMSGTINNIIIELTQVELEDFEYYLGDLLEETKEDPPFRSEDSIGEDIELVNFEIRKKKYFSFFVLTKKELERYPNELKLKLKKYESF